MMGTTAERREVTTTRRRDCKAATRRGWNPRTLPFGRPVLPLLLGAVLPLLFGCAKKPPAGYAPDPGLLARVQSIRIEVPGAACPGQTIAAYYLAVLDDGSELPFSSRYDDDDPPALHVSFLTRYSPNAAAQANGHWTTSDDPLASVLNGFPLQAILRAKPGVIARATVAPGYGCADHVFRFSGASGPRGGAGGPGPDVTLRLAVLSSPFVERLLVAELVPEGGLPAYLLADLDEVPPADWLVVRSRGGRGGRGTDGRDGAKGTAGAAGCPGAAGGAGGAGGNGGGGGAGGRGGRVTVLVPDTEPLLAGLVDARSQGGEAGEGGRAGKGGAGGAGGAAQGDPRRCKAGSNGADGPDGRPGRDGPGGQTGVRAQVLTVPAASVFGSRPRPELLALINYHEGARQ